MLSQPVNHLSKLRMRRKRQARTDRDSVYSRRLRRMERKHHKVSTAPLGSSDHSKSSAQESPSAPNSLPTTNASSSTGLALPGASFITIHVRTEGLPQQAFRMQASQAVFDLKCLIHGRTATHPADQRLIHLGRELENNKRLSDYSRIQDGAALLLAQRPRDVREENLWGFGIPLNKMIGRNPDT